MNEILTATPDDEAEEITILERTADGRTVYYPEVDAEMTATLESEVA